MYALVGKEDIEKHERTLRNIVCMHFAGIMLVFVSFLFQKEMLEVLYNVFQLKIPVWTEDYRAAVASVGEAFIGR